MRLSTDMHQIHFSRGRYTIMRLLSTTAIVPVTPPPTDNSRLNYGWDENWDGGTDGDWFIDPTVATSGDGTTPATAFKTVNEAITAAVAAYAVSSTPQDVKFMNGFHEAGEVSLDGFHGSLTRYGTHRPVVTGSIETTAWASATSADDGVLGSGHSGIYYIDVDKSTYASHGDPLLLNPQVNGLPIPICQDREAGADTFFKSYAGTMHSADALDIEDVSGDYIIRGITDADVLSKYTEQELQAAFAYVFYNSNNTALTNILSKPDANSIEVDGDLMVHGNTAAPAASARLFALVNILKNIQPGEWGYFDLDANTIRLYLRPEDVADLATVRICGAPARFEISPSCGDLRVQGLEFRGNSGNSSKSAASFFHAGPLWANERSMELVFEGNWFSGVDNNIFNGSGCIALSYATNCSVLNNSIGYMAETFGINFSGGSLAYNDADGTYDQTNVGRNLRVIGNHFYKIAKACSRMFAQHLAIFAYNFIDYVGGGSHANIFNFYAQCDRLLIWANITRRCYGYVTFQEASRIFYSQNDFEGSISGNSIRAVVDQNHFRKEPPFGPAACYFWENTVRPDHDDPSIAGGVDLGRDGTNDSGADGVISNFQYWKMWNNIVPGGGVDTSRGGERKGNVYVNTAWYQAPHYGWAPDPTELVSTLAANYVDVGAPNANGDYPVVENAPITTHVGVDVTEAVTAAQLHFPTWDFTLDRDKRPRVAGRVGCADFTEGSVVIAPTGLVLPPTLSATGFSTSASFNRDPRSTATFTSDGSGRYVFVAVRDLGFGTDTFGDVVISEPGGANPVSGTFIARSGRAQRQVMAYWVPTTPVGDCVATFTPDAASDAVGACIVAAVELGGSAGAPASGDVVVANSNSAAPSVLVTGVVADHAALSVLVRSQTADNTGPLFTASNAAELMELGTGTSSVQDVVMQVMYVDPASLPAPAVAGEYEMTATSTDGSNWAMIGFPIAPA